MGLQLLLLLLRLLLLEKMLKLAFLLVFSSAVFSSLVALGAKDAGSCPENWVDATLTGMGCLFFDSSDPVTWQEASVSCYRSNSSLVEIETELQLDFLRSEVQLLANSGISADWWTSATDLGREGRWYWASSLSPVPDFVLGYWFGGDIEQNCGQLDVNVDCKLNDYQCDSDHYGNTPFYPICQIK